MNHNCEALGPKRSRNLVTLVSIDPKSGRPTRYYNLLVALAGADVAQVRIVGADGTFSGTPTAGVVIVAYPWYVDGLVHIALKDGSEHICRPLLSETETFVAC